MRRLTCKRPIPIFWYFISQLLVEISIWNSYRTLIGSLSIHWKKWTFKGQGHRDGTLFFEGTVISQKLSNIKFLIKLSKKILKIWQSYSPVLLILSISLPNVVTIGHHLTSFVTCATFNMLNGVSQELDWQFLSNIFQGNLLSSHIN